MDGRTQHIAHPNLLLPLTPQITAHRARHQSPGLRTARPRDLDFLVHLQNRFSHELATLPKPALETYLDSKMVRLACENSQPAGYILWRHHLASQPELSSILQAAVELAAQRRHHGLALVADIAAEASANGQIGMQAICRVGHEANAFWRDAGFKSICIVNTDPRRQETAIVWRLPLVRKIPLWFIQPPARVGSRGKTPSLRRPVQWSEHVRTATFESLYGRAQEKTESPAPAETQRT